MKILVNCVRCEENCHIFHHKEKHKKWTCCEMLTLWWIILTSSSQNNEYKRYEDVSILFVVRKNPNIFHLKIKRNIRNEKCCKMLSLWWKIKVICEDFSSQRKQMTHFHFFCILYFVMKMWARLFEYKSKFFWKPTFSK